jgi:hypothetical protein
MGIVAFLRRLFFGAPAPHPQNGQPVATAPASAVPRLRSRPKLGPLRFRRNAVRTPPVREQSERCPYKFATPSIAGRFLNLSTDANPEALRAAGLPVLVTPEDLAVWLGLPLGKVAWLAGRFYQNHRPVSVAESHYHYRWLAKKSGGHRLIEAPKVLLKGVQLKILREILDKVLPHPSAFGFVAGRSAVMNASQHAGNYVVLKLDLENFYTTVRYSRVVAIFRSLGFSRAVALWLARLTTTAAPGSLEFPARQPRGIVPYLHRHLPQGAPTSPAIANLSAFAMDVRLAGLAKAFHANYSRYADDLTFSGSHRFAGALRDFIPLSQQVIRSERFLVNRAKRKVIRQNGRQIVTGIVVNERPNVSRADYDRLKATLHNCVRQGPRSQNVEQHTDYAGHLLGRIAWVASLNPARAVKLRKLYEKIDWNR